MARFLIIYLASSMAAATPSSGLSEPGVLIGIEAGAAEHFEHEPGADVSRQGYHFAFQGSAGSSGLSLGFEHEYSIFDIDPLPAPRLLPPPPGETDVDPSSNGHLHALSLPIDLSALLDDGWQWQLRPALSISSNLLKHPGDIDAKAWQLSAVLLHRWQYSPSASWQAGLIADHRFGNYRAYPSLSGLWALGRWQLQVGFPDTAIGAQLRPRLHSGFRLQPDGGRWRVHDEEVGDSYFKHQAWRAEGYLDWRIARAWRAQLSLGQRLESRYHFTLETGEKFRSRTDPPLQLGLTLVWQPHDSRDPAAPGARIKQ